LKERIAQLEADLAKAKKNSSNSSKPPSSDIAKPKNDLQNGKQKASGDKSAKRKRGGQPGHPRHERPPFDPSEIDRFFDYYYAGCPCCGGELEYREKLQRVLQQIELMLQPTEITEHRSLECFCAECDKSFVAPIPEDICRAGLVGPRLTTLIAYMKGACHCSFSTIRKFLRDIVGVKISRGQLRKVCGKVSQSLGPAYEELLQQLTQQAVLNVDETGHKDNGNRMWTWCFRASLFTLFKIDPSRGSDVLLEVLGKEFNGVLGCDYFSAYRKYMRLNENVLVQFCLAHFIRDVKFLVKHPNKQNRAYGEGVLEAVRQMFQVIHRREELSDEEFKTALNDASGKLTYRVIWEVPQTSEAHNLANRFQQHGDSYLQFVTTPGIEPTNNLAEQAIRFVVIDRHITQGSRSEAGQRWLERIWTTIATCTQQGRSVFDFLCESVTAYLQHRTGPSLAPNTS
jgi:transposase